MGIARDHLDNHNYRQEATSANVWGQTENPALVVSNFTLILLTENPALVACKNYGEKMRVKGGKIYSPHLP